MVKFCGVAQRTRYLLDMRYPRIKCCPIVLNPNVFTCDLNSLPWICPLGSQRTSVLSFHPTGLLCLPKFMFVSELNVSLFLVTLDVTMFVLEYAKIRDVSTTDFSCVISVRRKPQDMERVRRRQVRDLVFGFIFPLVILFKIVQCNI